MSVKWYGDKVMKALENANEAGLQAVAIDIEGQAKLLCPVQDGRLRGSISHATHTRRASGPDSVKTIPRKGEAIVGTGVEYAALVEYGTGIYGEPIAGRPTPRRQTPWVYFDEKLKKFFWTRGMKPRSFLRKAVDARRAVKP